MSSSWTDIAHNNFSALSENTYPGRGIIVGQTADASKMVQVYWIMGRSSNSRNRVFVAEDNNHMRTKAYDESRLEDPSLIIYYPIRQEQDFHIVSNGDQTDTLWEGIQSGKSFEQSLKSRQYEPDGPNFTPRITAMTHGHSYQMSILKSMMNSEGSSLRFFFNYSKAIPGLGHFLSTYEGDAHPLPSFAGEPRLMPLEDTAQANLDKYWEVLDEDNRVSLAVKTIDLETGQVNLVIKNCHE